MAVRNLSLAILLACLTLALNAQETMTTAAPGGAYRSLTPKDQWELGVHAGVPFVVGDVDAKFPGFGGGIHVRKAFDHIFSIRVSGLYAKTKNEGSETPASTSDNQWISGSAQLVAALNNFRFDRPTRRVLFNGIVGLGVMNFSSDFKNVAQKPDGKVDGTNAFVEVGAGLAFRFNPKINLGLEYTISRVFGTDGDLLDGDNNVGDDRTTFADLFHYPHVSLNFNLGGKDKNGMAKSEPLYWVNPLTQVNDAIAALEARPIYDPTDTDGDGIIDAIDDEDNSPSGARVDSKGVTLDSDSDKVPDYKDREPYSPPGYSVDANGVAQVPKPITEADVNRIVDAKLAAFKVPSSGLSNWFLPIVNFNLNRYDIKTGEYEKLYQVANVMKSNPTVKLVVIGNTDRSGSERYNNVLSYNRAKAAIDFLTTQYGIAADRLVLNWVGESNAIVPVNGSSQTNRRVEFRVATNETNMPRPEGPEAGKGDTKMKRFEGNKDAGF